MTETVSDAPPAAAGKRRGRPESRQRPQSRNPSAPMKPPEPAPEPESARASVPGPEPESEPAQASAPEPAPEPGREPVPEPQPAKSSEPPDEPELSTDPESSTGPGPVEGPEPAPGSEPGQAEAPGERTARRVRLRRVVRGGAGLPGRAWRAMPRPARRPAAERTPRFRPVLRRVLRRVLRGLKPRRLPLRRIPLPRWWPAALCVLVGVLAGLAYGLLRPAQFTATSYVAVVPGEEGDPMTALGFAQAYGRIATDTAVLVEAQQEAGVPVATLKSSVEAVTSPDAPMIEITGTAPRAGEAADIANAVARSLTEVSGDSAQATGVELTDFSRARAPRESSSPSPVLTTAVGGSAGLLVGALVLVVRPRREEEPAVPTASATAPEEPVDSVTPQQSRTPKKQTGPRGKRSAARERRNSGGRTREKEAVR